MECSITVKLRHWFNFTSRDNILDYLPNYTLKTRKRKKSI